jgi:hypothetical protein
MDSIKNQLKFGELKNSFYFVFVMFFLLYTSCTGENTQTDNGHTLHVVNYANVCTLTVVDSIGVELGDSNYVFGAVREVEIGPVGDIYIVDWIKCAIFRYSPNGEFLQQIGHRGNGPGEMLQPGDLAVMDDGSICIHDGENGWLMYDSEGLSVSSGLLLQPRPGRMMALDSTDILGMLSELGREDNFLITTKRICRWNSHDPDSSNQYLIGPLEDMNEFRRDLIRIDFFPMLFAAGEGFVCIAPEPRSEPVLLLFHADGSVMDTLMLPYPEVVRTEEDIQEQKLFIERHFYHTSGYTHQVDWDPFPNKPMISNLAVDWLNRIWVQRGFERYPVFDLFDSSGEYLMTAVLPDRDDTAHLKFHISRHGILAVPEDPESYYCVYLINLIDQV